ncbi:hypothetical protein HMPREF9123_0796 [Neisseria bacilliformis ATCC BAA-1200]|uniref:Uncharacterized protein n=1 Tax=Neisseria bacilliformis ATCC BAA-1200 TaxID=888742 RepID=F2BAP2_9NEIS|nr:hypothetical protein HMPREF9123_0796 [Neisseria bacilliformis ATCC BAA-1200]
MAEPHTLQNGRGHLKNGFGCAEASLSDGLSAGFITNQRKTGITPPTQRRMIR